MAPTAGEHKVRPYMAFTKTKNGTSEGASIRTYLVFRFHLMLTRESCTSQTLWIRSGHDGTQACEPRRGILRPPEYGDPEEAPQRGAQQNGPRREGAS